MRRGSVERVVTNSVCQTFAPYFLVGSTDELEFQVWDMDLLSKDYLGGVIYKISDIHLNEKREDVT